MNLKSKKILMTGADCFIGSHFVKALLAHGCDVRAFVYYNSFNSWGWIGHCNLMLRAEDVFIHHFQAASFGKLDNEEYQKIFRGKIC